jgi:hypothetical protein
LREEKIEKKERESEREIEEKERNTFVRSEGSDINSSRKIMQVPEKSLFSLQQLLSTIDAASILHLQKLCQLQLPPPTLSQS